MYDAVIIGAGIGGLVCGCYLAKAGMKVLIAEQHYKPGGYCTSFKRKGFTFDAAAHSFGGYKYGNLKKIFDDLGIDRKIKIRRNDPTDIIITPDYKVSFKADLDKTIIGFQNTFPHESENIRNFFHFLINPDPNSFVRIRSWTFKNLLDAYFNDDKLKAVIAFPLLGNGGLPPSLMSAFIGAKITTEHLLDGGYYPEGGMQSLSNALAEKFKEFGGELLLSNIVKKINVKDKKVTGIVLEKSGVISSKYVISNSDARQTFLKLLGKEIIGHEFLKIINNMTPTLSAFILYLGLNEYLDNLPKVRTNIWFLRNYNLDEVYQSARKLDLSNMDGYLLHVSPEQKIILAFLNAPFKNKKYWGNNKSKILESFILEIEKSTIPELSKHIVYKEAATPYTLYRFTLNYKGAAFGWESTPTQFAIPDFRKPSFLKGLYLTGHWSTQGLGIPGVAYSGYDTAKNIIKYYNKK